jgi:RNA polymerase sigma factor (sigma-70 family)
VVDDLLAKTDMQEDFTDGLPMLAQIENARLYRALHLLNDRDLRIIFAKVIDNLSISEIADELGIGYKTVFSVYTRMIEKIQKELGGDSK